MKKKILFGLGILLMCIGWIVSGYIGDTPEVRCVVNGGKVIKVNDTFGQARDVCLFGKISGTLCDLNAQYYGKCPATTTTLPCTGKLDMDCNTYSFKGKKACESHYTVGMDYYQCYYWPSGDCISGRLCGPTTTLPTLPVCKGGMTTNSCITLDPTMCGFYRQKVVGGYADCQMTNGYCLPTIPCKIQ